MTKSEKIEYFSQLLSFPWEMIAKSACGITSATMAISFFDPSVTPMKVLKKASELHIVPDNEKNYWVEVNDDGQIFKVPVGRELSSRFLESVKKEKLKVFDKGDRYGNYQPSYNISNGYDHRGSERLFKSFGIKAKMLGDKNKPVGLDVVKKEVEKGNMFLMSASRKNNPWMDIFGGKESNHIMLITDIVEKQDKKYFNIFDPFANEKLIHLEPVDKMTDFDFNGYGTLIYTK